MKIPAISQIFNEVNFGSLVRQFNVFTTNVGAQNMAGEIADNLTIPAGVSIKISHKLKITPKYRIILKQTNGGLIVDGDDNWTDSYISLKNTGGTDAIISVLMLKE